MSDAIGLIGTFQPNPHEQDVAMRAARTLLGPHVERCFPAAGPLDFAMGAWLAPPGRADAIGVFETHEAIRCDALTLVTGIQDGQTPWQALGSAMQAATGTASDVIFACMPYNMPAIDMRAAIYDETYDDPLVDQLHVHAWQAAEGVMSHDKALRSEAVREAFVSYLSTPAWASLSGRALEPIDLIALPSGSRVYSRALALRAKWHEGRLDADGYAEMLACLRQAVAIARRRSADAVYGTQGRNGPCACGSGRKYKGCHMRRALAVPELGSGCRLRRSPEQR